MTASKLLALVLTALVAVPIQIQAELPDPIVKVDPKKLTAETEVVIEGRFPKKIKRLESPKVPFEASGVKEFCLSVRLPGDIEGRIIPTRLKTFERDRSSHNPDDYTTAGSYKMPREFLENGAYLHCFNPAYVVSGRGQIFPLTEGDFIRVKKIRSKMDPEDRDLEKPGRVSISIQGVDLPAVLPYPPPHLAFFRVVSIGDGPGDIDIKVQSDVGYPETAWVSARWYDEKNTDLEGSSGNIIPGGQKFTTTLKLHQPPSGSVPAGVEVFVRNNRTGKVYAPVRLSCKRFAIRGCPLQPSEA